MRLLSKHQFKVQICLILIGVIFAASDYFTNRQLGTVIFMIIQINAVSVIFDKLIHYYSYNPQSNTKGMLFMKFFKKFKNQILLVLSTIAAVSTQYTSSQIGIIISVAIQAYVLCNACKLLDKSYQCDLLKEEKREMESTNRKDM